MPDRLHSFVTKYHTTTEQLAALANDAKPKLLVVYHTVAFRPGIASPKFLLSLQGTGASHSTEEILQEEIGSGYSGQFVIGSPIENRSSLSVAKRIIYIQDVIWLIRNTALRRCIGGQGRRRSLREHRFRMHKFRKMHRTQLLRGFRMLMLTVLSNRYY
jgi:hypothetical protein